MEAWRQEFYLAHSKKGTTWKDHKYIKRADGIYYYPDSYEGGRHLKGGSGNDDAKKTEMEDWEKTIHKHIESIVDQHPDLFGTTDKISSSIMSNPEAFKNTLKALTGMDNIPDDKLKEMQKKIASYYDDSTDSDSKSASKGSSKKGSKSKESSEKDSKDSKDKKTSEKDSKESKDEKKSEKESEVKKEKKDKKLSKRDEKAAYYAERYGGTLRHHGILGQRWGVRRYQNKDGTLTDAGMRRLGQYGKEKKVNFDEKTGKLASGETNRRRAQSAIYNEVSKDYSDLSNSGRGASDAAKSGASIARRAANRERQNAQSQMDVSHMTDKQLQQAINRMNLERTYKSLSTEDIGAGKIKAADVLATIGDVMAIGVAATTILSFVYKNKS